MTALADEIHGLLFNIRRSARYHLRRRSFFERLHKATAAINVISASTSFVGIIGAIPWLSTAAAATVTVFSTLDLVIGSSQMAREHSDLAKSFIDLERSIIKKPNDKITKEDISDFTDRRLEIESKEPNIHRVLDAIVYNEMCRSMGYKNEKDMFKVGFFQSLFAQWFDFLPSKMTHPNPNEDNSEKQIE